MSSPEGAARVLLGAEGGVLAAVHRLEVVARLGHGHHGRGDVPAPRLDSRVHSGATPLLRGFSRKNIFCQKIFDNFFSFQATEMVLTSKWGRIQQEIQI